MASFFLTQFLTSLLWVTNLRPHHLILSLRISVGYYCCEARPAYRPLRISPRQCNDMSHLWHVNFPPASNHNPAVAGHLCRCCGCCAWLRYGCHWHQQWGSGVCNSGVGYLTNEIGIFIDKPYRFCWGFGGVAGAIIGGTCKHFNDWLSPTFNTLDQLNLPPSNGQTHFPASSYWWSIRTYCRVLWQPQSHSSVSSL